MSKALIFFLLYSIVNGTPIVRKSNIEQNYKLPNIFDSSNHRRYSIFGEYFNDDDNGWITSLTPSVLYPRKRKQGLLLCKSYVLSLMNYILFIFYLFQ